MSAKFLNNGLALWRESVNKQDLHDIMQAFVRTAYPNVSSQRPRMAKLKKHIISAEYTTKGKPPDIKITKLGMSPARKKPSKFIQGGFKVYETNKGSDNLKDKLIDYVVSTYTNPKTRNTSFINLKKAIADKYDDDKVIEFKLPRKMYDEVFAIDRDAVKAKGRDCITIDNTDKLFDKLLKGIKSNDINELLPAVLLATGRRLSEITSTAVFKPTDNQYVTSFTGQLKTDDSKPYDIPTMVNTTNINNALNKIRTELKANPQLGASGYVSNYITDIAGIQLSAHQLRAIYATAMYNKRPDEFKSYNEPVYVSMILGHKLMDTVPHYVCWTLNKLTKVQYEFASTLNHNRNNRAEVRCVANIEAVIASGKRLTQAAVRKLGTSPAVFKRVMAQNPGL